MRTEFRLFLAFITAVVCGNSYSDEVDEGVKYFCNSGVLEIEELNILNNEPIKLRERLGERAYLGSEQINFECKIGKHIAKITLKNRKPREKGMCGSAPGAYISLILDGEEMITKASIGNECFESLEKVKLSEAKRVGFIFEICGHKSLGANPHFSGCLRFRGKVYKKLPMPLGAHPISFLIDNNALNLGKRKLLSK